MRTAFYKLKLIRDAMITPIFFKDKPLRALVSLGKKDKIWYASMLCKEIDCTYPHMMKLMDIFESEGLIKTEGQGRINIIRLTEKGEDLSQELENLLRRIDKLDDSKK